MCSLYKLFTEFTENANIVMWIRNDLYQEIWVMFNRIHLLLTVLITPVLESILTTSDTCVVYFKSTEMLKMWQFLIDNSIKWRKATKYLKNSSCTVLHRKQLLQRCEEGDLMLPSSLTLFSVSVVMWLAGSSSRTVELLTSRSLWRQTADLWPSCCSIDFYF